MTDSVNSDPFTATKYCSRGKHTVALSEFGDNAIAPDGKQWWCKPCQRAYWKFKAQARAAAKRAREFP